jgi:hypothetical protein
MNAQQMPADHVARLRRSMIGAIRFAVRRQQKRADGGRQAAAVTVTVDELMAILARQDHRCALTGLPFYSGAAGSFSPRRPPLDRIDHDGPYAAGNLRVILPGVNGLRGTADDAEMLEIAHHLLLTRRRVRYTGTRA